MNEKANNIKIIDDKSCTGCGTCSGLCPKDAIQMIIDKNKGIYVPELDEERCNHCGFCLKVCPGYDVDFKALNLKVFGKEPNNILIGNYLNCYVGHAKDYDIRYNSASGGLVTQLLISSLDEGIIDGALVTRMRKDIQLEPESLIARTKEEIIAACGSKYCPVPANIALREIIKAKKNERFAVVGLPCHILGLRKAQMISTMLQEQVVMCVGIMCSHTVNFFGTEFLLKKIGIDKQDVMKLDYRGEGWPGSMKIHLKNDKELLIPLPNYWSIFNRHFFTPIRCLLCSDGICEFADISFGDAWLPELLDDKIGKSIIVSKSEIGEKLLQAMKLKNNIELERIDANKVIQSQIKMLHFKKKSLNARSKLFKVAPKNNNLLLESDSMDYLLALFPYLNAYISSKSFLRDILKYLPSKIIDIYGLPFSKLDSKKIKKDFDKFLNSR